MLLRAGLDQIARTQANFEFDLERRVLSEDAAAQSGAAAAPQQQPQPMDDPFQLVLERYCQMGYEVCCISGTIGRCTSCAVHANHRCLTHRVSRLRIRWTADWYIALQREEVAMALAAHDGQEEQAQVTYVVS